MTGSPCQALAAAVKSAVDKDHSSLLVLSCRTRSHRRHVDVIVPEADDATHWIEQSQSWNEAPLGASGGNEVGDRDCNQIGPREPAKQRVGDFRLRPAATPAAGGTGYEVWIFLRDGVSAIGALRKIVQPVSATRLPSRPKPARHIRRVAHRSDIRYVAHRLRLHCAAVEHDSFARHDRQRPCPGQRTDCGRA